MDGHLPSLRNTMNNAVTTSLYRPRQNKPLELLPSYHGLAFQEQDDTMNSLAAGPRTHFSKHRFNEITDVTDSSHETNNTTLRGRGQEEELDGQNNNDHYNDGTSLPQDVHVRGAPKIFRPKLSQHVAAIKTSHKVRRQMYNSAPLGDIPPLPDHMRAALDAAEPPENAQIAAAMDMLVEDPVSAKALIRETAQKRAMEAEEAARHEKSIEDDEDPNAAAVRSLFRGFRKKSSHGAHHQQKHLVVPDDQAVHKTMDDTAIATRDTDRNRTTTMAETFPSPRRRLADLIKVTTPASAPFTRETIFSPPPHDRMIAAKPTAVHEDYETFVRQDIENLVKTIIPEDEPLPVEVEDAMSAGVSETMEKLRWVLYAERYERMVIEYAQVNESPIPWCTSGPNLDTIVPSSGCVLHEMTFPNDDQLEDCVTNSIQSAIKRYQGESEANMKALQKAKEEQSLPSPVPSSSNSLTPLEALDVEATAEKQKLFDSACSYHRILSDMWDVILEEKAQRLAVLGEYISCAYPEPCKCVQWDMEILEDSAVFLEPKIHPACHFVSIVMKNYATLQDELLAERQRQLDTLYDTYELNFIMLYVYDNYRDDEQKEWDRLMEYHAYCMTEAAWRGHAAASRWVAIHVKEPMFYPRLHRSPDDPPIEVASTNNNTRPPLLRQPQDEFYGRAIIGSLDSPFCTYYGFMELAISIRAMLLSRSRLREAEEYERARLERALNQRWRLLSLEADRRRSLEAIQEEEDTERYVLMRTFERGEKAIVEAQYEIAEADAAVLIHDLSVMHLKDELQVSHAALEQKYYEELRKILLLHCEQRRWIEVRGRAQLSSEASAALAVQWTFDHNFAYIQTEEHRLRERMEEEEIHAWEIIRSQVEWFNRDVFGSYASIVEARGAQLDMFSIQLEEMSARIECSALQSSAYHELFTATQMTPAAAEPVSPVDALEGLPPSDTDVELRRLVVSNLNEFMSDDCIQDIFS